MKLHLLTATALLTLPSLALAQQCPRGQNCRPAAPVQQARQQMQVQPQVRAAPVMQQQTFQAPRQQMIVPQQRSFQSPQQAFQPQQRTFQNPTQQTFSSRQPVAAQNAYRVGSSNGQNPFVGGGSQRNRSNPFVRPGSPGIGASSNPFAHTVSSSNHASPNPFVHGGGLRSGASPNPFVGSVPSHNVASPYIARGGTAGFPGVHAAGPSGGVSTAHGQGQYGSRYNAGLGGGSMLGESGRLALGAQYSRTGGGLASGAPGAPSLHAKGGYGNSRYTGMAGGVGSGGSGGHGAGGAFVAGAAIGALAGFAVGSALPPAAPDGPAYFYEGRRHEPFYGGVYIWPAGYAYSPLAEGAYLPPVFATSTYFINNYGYYGLSAPPPAYRWVRYGPDMVLIRLADDAVMKVVKGVFLPGGRASFAAASSMGGLGWYDPEELPGDLPPPGVMQ